MLIKEKGISTLYIILMVGAVMLGLTAGVVFFWHSHGAAQMAASTGTVPTEDEKAYFSQLEVTDVRMSAAENFLGSTVTYLDGRVTNKGTKTVRRLDFDLTFVDTLNQVVLRERIRPVTQHSSPLKPGQSRAFRITFEHMPADWNQAAPTVVPAYVEF